jgi:hypothetical protein
MKMHKFLSTLALAAAVSAGCGLANDLFGTDGGNAACPTGTTLYRVPVGTYNTLSAQVISDTCGSGLTAAMLMNPRMVQNDTTTGNIIIQTADGTTELGRGPVRCNTGSLSNSAGQHAADGTCDWITSRTSVITVTADGAFTLNLTDARSSYTNVSNCSKAAGSSCTVNWTATMKQ